ncbi:hypothetical protein L210DRAFT_950397, partial [Boletus edulis BED1]
DGGINVRKLKGLLNRIDFEEIRKRRAVKLINDHEALGLKELQVREEMLKLVADLLPMISLRREFLQKRHKAAMEAQSMVPTILINAASETSLPGTSASREIAVNRESALGRDDGQMASS